MARVLALLLAAAIGCAPAVATRKPPATLPARIAIGETLVIEIDDLETPGSTTVQTLVVDAAGMIRLKYYGKIQAAGLTEAELRKAIEREMSNIKADPWWMPMRIQRVGWTD
jgi:protein involved in polysaccharide export with SLBB domain